MPQKLSCCRQHQMKTNVKKAMLVFLVCSSVHPWSTPERNSIYSMDQTTSSPISTVLGPQQEAPTRDARNPRGIRNPLVRRSWVQGTSSNDLEAISIRNLIEMASNRMAMASNLPLVAMAETTYYSFLLLLVMHLLLVAMRSVNR